LAGVLERMDVANKLDAFTLGDCVATRVPDAERRMNSCRRVALTEHMHPAMSELIRCGCVYGCITFDQLIALRAKVAQWLEGETLHGSLWRAGLPKTMLAETA